MTKKTITQLVADTERQRSFPSARRRAAIAANNSKQQSCAVGEDSYFEAQEETGALEVQGNYHG